MTTTNKQQKQQQPTTVTHLTTRLAEKWVSSIYFRRVSIAYVLFYFCNYPGCGFSVLFRYAHGGVDSSHNAVETVLCYSPISWPWVMVSGFSNTPQQCLIYNKSLDLPQPMNWQRMSNTSMFRQP